jgi:hypothetical protein
VPRWLLLPASQLGALRVRRVRRDGLGQRLHQRNGDGPQKARSASYRTDCAVRAQNAVCAAPAASESSACTSASCLLPKFIGTLAGLTGTLLLRLLYRLLKNSTWRRNKNAAAVAQHLRLDLGWYRADNLAAVMFAGNVEALIERHVGADPSPAALQRFAEALRVALGDNLLPRPLCGIGGLPSCSAVSCMRSSYLRDPQLLAADSLEQRLHAQLAAVEAGAREGRGAARGAADMEVPLLDQPQMLPAAEDESS